VDTGEVCGGFQRGRQLGELGRVALSVQPSLTGLVGLVDHVGPGRFHIDHRGGIGELARRFVENRSGGARRFKRYWHHASWFYLHSIVRGGIDKVHIGLEIKAVG
jgi:hypothetical protein